MTGTGVEMRNEIVELIKQVIVEENELLKEPIDLSKGELSPLYGREGYLDSIGLVTVVVAVEQAIQTKLSRRLTLANDRAVSSRASPFATVGSFADYVLSQVSEAPGV